MAERKEKKPSFLERTRNAFLPRGSERWAIAKAAIAGGLTLGAGGWTVDSLPDILDKNPNSLMLQSLRGFLRFLPFGIFALAAWVAVNTYKGVKKGK